MATIVWNPETEERYVLLGAGFGAYKALRPSMFLGNLAPHEEKGELPVALVCDAEGTTQWVHSETLQVLSIDGERPAAVLAHRV